MRRTSSAEAGAQPNRLEMIRALLQKIPREVIDSKLAEFREKAINPSTFTHYDRTTINRHQKAVDSRKESIRESNDEELIPGLSGLEVTLLSEYAEYLIFQGLDENKWLPFCSAIKTSPFDDIMNGVDAVVEYNNEAIAHVGLGIDISFSRRSLSEKIQGIREEIDAGTLTSLEYFESEESGNKGQLLHIPRVVVALDIPVIADLHKYNSDIRHPMRLSLIRQVKLQLEIMHEYAQSKNKSRAAEKIGRALRFFTAIHDQLNVEENYQDSGYTKNQAIESELERVLRDEFEQA